MNRKRLLVLFILLALVLSSCSAKADKPQFYIASRDALKVYSSTFLMTFDGPTKWRYQVQTRKAAPLTETALHLDGVPKAQNPGDVRIVTDGKTTWMTGPGTDNECVQYPRGMGMDPVIVMPDTLWPNKKLASILKYTEETKIAGRDSYHYVGKAAAYEDMKNVSFEAYTDKASGELLSFSMKGAGKDTLFNAGEGTLTAVYAVDGFDTPKIEPVTGCEVGLPVPASAVNLVRLPGMSSFDSKAALSELSAYYQAEMPKAGWVESEPPAQVEGATVLSYVRNAEQVKISVKAESPSGSQVKLLFLQK